MSVQTLFRMYNKENSLTLRSWKGTYSISVFPREEKNNTPLLSTMLHPGAVLLLRDLAQKLTKADEGTTYTAVSSRYDRENTKWIPQAFISLVKETTEQARYHLKVKNVQTNAVMVFPFTPSNAFAVIEPVMSPHELSEFNFKEFIKILGECAVYNAATYEEYTKTAPRQTSGNKPAGLAVPPPHPDDDIPF